MNYTLITGGSSGIGLETARLFAANGFSLILVSNEKKSLEEDILSLAKKHPSIDIKSYCCDLTKETERIALHQFVHQDNLNIELLINNAGFGTFGFYDEVDTEIEMQMIQLNVMGVYHLTRLFLKDMIQKNHGQIINISSISAFQPNPTLAAYGATKSFVMNYSRALNFELKKKQSKVRVSTICPTPVQTGFAKKAKMEQSQLFDSWMTVTTQDVANTIWKAKQTKKEMIVPKNRFHFLNKLTRRLPTYLVMWIGARELRSK